MKTLKEILLGESAPAPKKSPMQRTASRNRILVVKHCFRMNLSPVSGWLTHQSGFTSWAVKTGRSKSLCPDGAVWGLWSQILRRGGTGTTAQSKSGDAPRTCIPRKATNRLRGSSPSCWLQQVVCAVPSIEWYLGPFQLRANQTGFQGEFNDLGLAVTCSQHFIEHHDR